MNRKTIACGWAGLVFGLLLSVLSAWGEEALPPILIGLDAEFKLKHSTSAQAIEMGIRVAMAEINQAGGLLGGRPLQLETRDNRSIPARAMVNLRELAAMPEMVAVFCGRYSPVVLELLPLLQELKMILLDPWASADLIVPSPADGSLVFRLSLQDRYAMPTILRHAQERGLQRVGLMLPNTGWGRSNLAAAQRHTGDHPVPEIVETVWYNWGDQSLMDNYQKLRQKGAQAVAFVANDIEAIILVKEMAQLPPEQRIPLISHWGVTGGDFVGQVGEALTAVDYTVIQTFSFFTTPPERVARFLATAKQLYGLTRIEEIASPVGVGHAYDLTHILARAITLAGSTDRAAVRDALERVTDYHGLVHDFPRPFTPASHEALNQEDVFLARFRKDGAIIPLSLFGRP